MYSTIQKSNKSHNVYDPTISSCVVEYKQSSIIYITINLNRLIILKMFLETTRIIFVTLMLTNGKSAILDALLRFLH